jgi:tRNA1Val (adenine37-N6)-methyltransferase
LLLTPTLMTPLPELPTTDDAFLGGRLILRQPRKGYRAGMDALLLGAAVSALPFRNCLDAGCGVGGAMLTAARLIDHDGRLSGLEKDEAAGALAVHNVDANGLAGRVEVVTGDVLMPPAAMLGAFDLVFSNPPFFDDDSAIRPPSEERTAAWIAGVPLEAWIKSMAKLCAPKGHLLVLHRAERMGDILNALDGRAGDAVIYPVRPRAREAAKRVIICAKVGSRAPMRLLKGLDLHPQTGEGRFTPEAEAVFAGSALPGFGL